MTDSLPTNIAVRENNVAVLLDGLGAKYIVSEVTSPVENEIHVHIMEDGQEHIVKIWVRP